MFYKNYIEKIQKFFFFFSLVDTSQAGEGELEVLVEKGVVPCVVTAEGPRGQHTVTFVPKEAKVHSISVSFNGQVVRGEKIFVLYLKIVFLHGSND